MNVKKSKPVKSQKTYYCKHIKLPDDDDGRIDVTVSYDDPEGKGYNTFTVLGEIYNHLTYRGDKYLISSGDIPHDIEKYMPEIRHLLKWQDMNNHKLLKHPTVLEEFVKIIEDLGFEY